MRHEYYSTRLATRQISRGWNILFHSTRHVATHGEQQKNTPTRRVATPEGRSNDYSARHAAWQRRGDGSNPALPLLPLIILLLLAALLLLTLIILVLALIDIRQHDSNILESCW